MYPFCSPYILVLLFVGPIFLLCSAATWTAHFNPNKIQIHMSTINTVALQLDGLSYSELVKNSSEIYAKSSDEKLAIVNKQIRLNEISPQGKWNGSFDIKAIFLGNPDIYVEIINSDRSVQRSDQILPVIIIREERIIDHVFIGSVAALVSILYINFGAALDITKLRGIISRPIGPIIGFCCQFIIMPLLSYGLGLLLFPDSIALQLGLFFTGVSPSGGASNIWTVILGGNMDLSITMTALSTIAAFGMMPLWLFTLGKVIFDRGNLKVPYQNLTTYVVALIIPLIIGLLIQRYWKRFGNFLVRILKTLSIVLIVFIVLFAIITNLYLFELFSWQIIVAGLALPWFGYTLSWIIAKVLKQHSADALAIAIETGVQNTGIAIFILRLSLEQPQADLTTVVPVSVAMMTPLPLFCIYVYQQIRKWRQRNQDPLDNVIPDEVSPLI